MSDASVFPSNLGRRPWIRTVTLGGVILVCGFLIGAGVSGHVLWNRFLHGARSPERMHAQITEHLIRSLDLTEEQARQVRDIMDEHRRRQAEILEETRPRLEEEIERLRIDVAAVLTPEQAERWNARMEEFRQRWIGPPPWRDHRGRRFRPPDRP
jgi:Spy/CpxP family protein refolding chaperone